ncbi:MAG: XdhC family protein [Sandaracinaceae bacterium]|nr:XdhC family protein [Sandaracinaceae bacterium]
MHSCVSSALCHPRHGLARPSHPRSGSPGGPSPHRRALRYPDAATLPSRGTGSALSGADCADYSLHLDTEERFPACERVLAEPSEAALATSERDWILVMTHDHRLDEEALDTYARAPHAYLGVIGSRRKIYRMLSRIAARRGLPSLAKVYAPVGLDIGAVSPEEIAVSVAAELVALRHGASGAHMRAMDDPALAKVLGGQLSPEAAAQLERPR